MDEKLDRSQYLTKSGVINPLAGSEDVTPQFQEQSPVTDKDVTPEGGQELNPALEQVAHDKGFASWAEYDKSMTEQRAWATKLAQENAYLKGRTDAERESRKVAEPPKPRLTEEQEVELATSNPAAYHRYLKEELRNEIVTPIAETVSTINAKLAVNDLRAKYKGFAKYEERINEQLRGNMALLQVPGALDLLCEVEEKRLEVEALRSGQQKVDEAKRAVEAGNAGKVNQSGVGLKGAVPSETGQTYVKTKVGDIASEDMIFVRKDAYAPRR